MSREQAAKSSVLADLDLSDAEMRVVVQTGQDFYLDFTKFVQWFGQKEQKMLLDLPGTRKRYLKKIGRNEPCPCGSGRKFKNCCGASQA